MPLPRQPETEPAARRQPRTDEQLSPDRRSKVRDIDSLGAELQQPQRHCRHLNKPLSHQQLPEDGQKPLVHRLRLSHHLQRKEQQHRVKLTEEHHPLPPSYRKVQLYREPPPLHYLARKHPPLVRLSALLK